MTKCNEAYTDETAKRPGKPNSNTSEEIANQITAILSDYYIGGLVSAEEALKSIHDLLKKE